MLNPLRPVLLVLWAFLCAMGASPASANELRSPQDDACCNDDRFNVRVFGAVGNDVTDDTAAIQSAINAAAAAVVQGRLAGGLVYFPAGNYKITAPLLKKAGVSLDGQAMIGDFADTKGSILRWHGPANSTMVNTVDQDLRGTSISRLKFQNATTQVVTGILGGSVANNSAKAVFDTLKFYRVTYPIRGDGAATYGIFDSLFVNIHVWQDGDPGAPPRGYGLWFHGSGNTLIQPRIVGCLSGITLDYLSGESKAGVEVVGGVFIGNDYDISISPLTPNGIRPCSFRGTWFENSLWGIANVPQPGTHVMSMTFDNCMMQTKNTIASHGLLNLWNAKGAITVSSCTLKQTLPGQNVQIISPSP